MANLTESETKVLKSLCYNHYGDGHCTWSWATNESQYPSGINGKELSGVLSSLTKKGLVKPCGKGEDASIDTTAEGLAEMRKQGWEVL